MFRIWHFFLLTSFFLIAAPATTIAVEATEPTPLESVLEQIRIKELDIDLQWWNLLNFRRDFLWENQSQADAESFYVSKNGKTDPTAELTTFVQMLYQAPSNPEESVQCLFPGRYLYLKQRLPSVRLPEATCQRFEDFRKVLDAHSATYVFSSYYLNNPASAYGHSFLRLNRGGSSVGGTRYELIDFGVGYAGVPEGDTPASYAIMGLIGLFTGQFEVRPYYFKVREYNNFESRDLWEYDLNLSQQEVDLLVAHIFELQRAGFDYWYFTENCSYRILAALDAVRPSLNLIGRTKRAILPGDTMIMVQETPGLVKAIHYRPSSRAVFQNRYAALSPSEKSRMDSFIVSENLQILNEAPEDERLNLLDTAIDYVDFRYASEVAQQKGQHPLKRAVLLARSEIPTSSKEISIQTPPREAPHEAHGSSRYFVGYLHRNQKDLTTVSHRFALHDLLDPLRGYPTYSEMQMVGTDFSYEPDSGKFQFEKLSLVEIVSLSPWNELSHTPSWRLKFAWDRNYQTECRFDCMPLEFQLGVGLSKQLRESWIVSAWLRGGAAYDESFIYESTRFGIGPAVLVRYNLRDKFSLLAESWYRYDNTGTQNEYQDFRIGAQLNFSEDWSARLEARNNEEYRAQLQLYY